MPICCQCCPQDAAFCRVLHVATAQYPYHSRYLNQLRIKIVLDNVSDPAAIIGEVQLAWLADDPKKLDTESMITVLTHRPLFDLYPQWDWATRDGAKAVDLLMPFKHATVFYGHIHQEHHYMTRHIPHHAAHGLMCPLPGPGSVPKKAPIPWDPEHPYKGLGFREPKALAGSQEYRILEYPVRKGDSA